MDNKREFTEVLELLTDLIESLDDIKADLPLDTTKAQDKRNTFDDLRNQFKSAVKELSEK